MMTPTRKSLVLICAAVSFAIAGFIAGSWYTKSRLQSAQPVFYADTGEPLPAPAATGMISMRDFPAFSLTLADGSIKNFRVEKGTKLMLGGAMVSPDTLQQGSYVAVFGTVSLTGEIEALAVQLFPQLPTPLPQPES